MPTILEIERGQSESAFDVNIASYVYIETALQPTRGFPGRTAYQQEVARLLPGYSFNNRGDSYANPPNEPPLPVRWGGTSFVDDWIAPPTTLAWLQNNDDPLLLGRKGQDYFNSLDSILASYAAAADAISIQWFRQTWESADGSWPFDIAAYARAITLFTSFEAAKAAAIAPGKPFAVFVIMPGQTDRGGLNHALMREVHLHLAVNGRRSSRAALQDFPVLPHFRIGASAIMEFAMATAYTADTGLVGGSGNIADNAHQSAGSVQRTAMGRAIEMVRWLAPSQARPYQALPILLHAFPKSGDPNTLRLRVKITPGNYLVWQGPDPLDADITLLGAFSSNPERGHIFLHATAINSTTVPTNLGATVATVAVDNSDRDLGWGYLDISFPSAAPSSGFVSISPSQVAPSYTRRAAAIATDLKKKIGLFEAQTLTPQVTAAFEDLLGPAPSYVLPVTHITNLPILTGDPITMADLASAGITLVENYLRTQATHAGLLKSGTEVAASGYSRASITWTAPGSAMENTNTLNFGTFTDTGINQVGLYSAASGGSLLAVKAISAIAPSAQAVSLAAGALDGVAA